MNDEPRGELDRRFAGMLGELEDAETALVTRQAELSRELAKVDGELDRLTKVKAAMLGGDRPKARRSRSGGRARQRADENRDRIMAWVGALENGHRFTASEVAEAVGMSTQGMGPILAGLARGGEIVQAGEERREGTGNRMKVYARA